MDKKKQDLASQEPPPIEELEFLAADTSRWEPTPAIEQRVLDTLKGIVPIELRASDKMLEDFYDKGLQLYKIGKYKQALPFFQMLNTIHPKHPKYYMATAACCQLMKEYLKAVAFYSLAAMLDELNPYPQYYMAGCLLKAEQPIAALIALEVGIERCQEPLFEPLRGRMQFMIDCLHKELEEKKAAGLL